MKQNNDFKIKLIFPIGFELLDKNAFVSSSYPPYGIGVLTAFLRSHSYYVGQEDFSVRYNWFNRRRLPPELRSVKGNDLFIDKMIDFLALDGFNIVGFSIFSALQLKYAQKLAKIIKQRYRAIVVFGGTHINLYGHLLTEMFDYVDYMVVGDGRVALLKLIDHLQGGIDLSDVPNIIYKNNNKVLSNPREYYPIEDIPMPDFYGLPLNLYKKSVYKNDIVLTYQVSRGCPSKCSFCIYPEMSPKLEFKSYGKILRELREMIIKYNSSSFYFCDDAINHSYKYLEGLCDVFIKEKLDIIWASHAKVGNLDNHILNKMKKAGCVRLEFGIESGSDRLLKSMNKGFTREEAGKQIKMVAETGIIVISSLIVGFPYENKEDIEKTRQFILENKKYIKSTYVYKFCLSYGSSMFKNPETYGIENVIPISTDRCGDYRFDEINGLKWGKKIKQQKYSASVILKAASNSSVVKFNRRHRFFISHGLELFWPAFVYVTGLHNVIKLRISRVLERIKK